MWMSRVDYDSYSFIAMAMASMLSGRAPPRPSVNITARNCYSGCAGSPCLARALDPLNEGRVPRADDLWDMAQVFNSDAQIPVQACKHSMR